MQRCGGGGAFVQNAYGATRSLQWYIHDLYGHPLSCCVMLVHALFMAVFLDWQVHVSKVVRRQWLIFALIIDQAV